MNIGIYIETAKDAQPRGVGFHVVNLLQELATLDQENRYFLYYQRPLLNGTPQPEHVALQENFQLRPIAFPDKWTGRHPRLWWDYWLPARLRQDRLDVMHCPSHFLPALPGVKLVLTIHDVAYFKMDRLYSPGITETLRVWTSKSLQRASRVIALSRNTAVDLEDHGVERGRIRVIYGGGNVIPSDRIRMEKANEVRDRYRLPHRYILYLGTLHPRKNVLFLLRAYAELRRNHGLTHGLVLVGKPDSATDDVKRTIQELGLDSDVTITGYVADWEVPLLYKMADLFVLPTLYEGFTLVTLEAMHYGVPVIATDTSSIREGVGDAGILVPLNDVPALAAAMAKVLQDPEFRADLVERGKQQAQKFTWRECARQTLDLYHEVVNGN
jgi:glycosyltransferase involved in cell wall biosynthesis